MAATNYQLKAELRRRGILDACENSATNLGGDTKLAWDHAPEFDAASPAIARVFAGANISASLLPAVFTAAELIAT